MNMNVFKLFLKEWRYFVKLFTPLAFSWMPFFYPNSESRCAYVILVMAVYFMTEALPLAVTALIPVFAFPLFGIISTDVICQEYMRGTAMMFFGGLAVAIAVEHSNLHKRIALFVILKVGQSPRRLMGGFMITTMFLSMWISNTAATAMMAPILDAILQELYKHSYRERKNSSVSLEIQVIERASGSFKLKRKPIENNNEVEQEEVRTPCGRLVPPDEESNNLSTMYFLALAYGANIGGTGFPTGSSPNLVLWEILQSSFPDGTGLDFATWMAFNIPGMLICVTVTWIWLEILFLGFGSCKKKEDSKEKEASIKRLVEKNYTALGTITFHEVAVSVMFAILVLLWVFRAPEFISGWADILHGLYHNDLRLGNASPAILVVFLLFVFPARIPSWREKLPTPACLTWQVVHEKVPWGLILLMGGGFAMAKASVESGLSELIKIHLSVLTVFPPFIIVLLVCFVISFLTEIVSNATAAAIFIPVLKDMALALHMNPLYLMLPGTICCSYALMLPVANPPNAIVFNASTMKNSDMMKAGIVLKIICVLILCVLTQTLGVAIFDLNNFPAWAANSTDVSLHLLSNSSAGVSYSI